jgi:long-subunit acyl-CoA synthetase (AMP-forming)
MQPATGAVISRLSWRVVTRTRVPRNTLIDYFDDLARAEGQFLVYDAGFRARSHSYVEVGRAARGIASRLAGAGVRKGDQVVFWSENRPERIVAFWSCLLGGVIVVPIDYRASPALLARIATRVMARLILVGEDVPPVPEAVAVSVWRLHELQWRDEEPPPTAIGGDDVAEIIFTAGAAPLDAELEAFWSARGFAVIRGYGLTETAPIVSVTHPFHIQAGSVGKAIPGVDVEIAPDGEILVLDHGVDPDAVVRDANARLEAHQNIRRAQVWPEAVLPRTEGTGKLRRATIRE